jgi:hypothetical protein
VRVLRNQDREAASMREMQIRRVLRSRAPTGLYIYIFSYIHQSDWPSHKKSCRLPDDLIDGDIVELFGLDDSHDSQLSNGMNFEVKRKEGSVAVLVALGNSREFSVGLGNMRRVLKKEKRPH